MFSALTVYALFYGPFINNCCIYRDPRRGCPDLSNLVDVLGKARTGREA